jgi:large subunit ribosomal protein L19
MTEEKKKSKVRPAEKSAAKKKPAAAAENKTARESQPVKDTATKDAHGRPESRSDIPAIKPGDELKVFYRVIEAGKERTQIYEGTVIAIKNSGISKTITVRKNSFGIAVERIFPLNSKLVQKIEVKKHTRVRRAKLFYLRKLKGKASRLKELR